MTPDFLAGLLIGSFAVYACWLLSLRLAEREEDEEDRRGLEADRARYEGQDWRSISIPLDDGERGMQASSTSEEPPDPVLAALLVLGEELDD